VLPVFEAARPDDARPRAAIGAAREFINGARRTKLQRLASLEAHRAARDATDEAVRLAARSASDAASVAYLHPLAPSWWTCWCAIRPRCRRAAGCHN